MDEKDIHKGHRQRVKDRFLSEGLKSFSLHNILELILFYSVPRIDVNVLAHRLELRFGSLRGVMDASSAELTSVNGVSENTATLLKLFPAVCKEYMTENMQGETFDSREKVGDFLVSEYIGVSVETVFLLMLDNSRRMIACEELFKGSINSSGIDIRKVAERALQARASSIVLAHNHPNGVAFPSGCDMKMTDALESACEVLNISFWDHYIIAGDGYYMIKQKKFNRASERRGAMIASIDRFEGDIAVIITDDEKKIEVDRSILYPGAKQHDIVEVSGVLGRYTIVYLPEETEKRKSDVEALFDRLRKKKQ